MGEKNFASLSSGLLARKGAAKPAMRRQGYMNPQGDVGDDLGWNDMGFEPPKPIDIDGVEFDGEEASGAEPPAIHEQLKHLANGFGIHPLEDEAESDDAHLLDGHAGLSAMDDEVEQEAAFESEALETEPVEAEHVEATQAEADQAEAEHAEAENPQVVEALSAEESIEPPVAQVIPMRPSAPDPKDERVLARDKVAFTLRLDKERHLKLRLASALENRSAQQLVTEALDIFFKATPDLDRFAASSRDRT